MVVTDLTGLPSGSDCLLLGPLPLPPLSSPFFMLASSSSTSSPSRRLNLLSSSSDDASCSRHDISSALQHASYGKQVISPEQGPLQSCPARLPSRAACSAKATRHCSLICPTTAAHNAEGAVSTIWHTHQQAARNATEGSSGSGGSSMRMPGAGHFQSPCFQHQSLVRGACSASILPVGQPGGAGIVVAPRLPIQAVPEQQTVTQRMSCLPRPVALCITLSVHTACSTEVPCLHGCL